MTNPALSPAPPKTVEEYLQLAKTHMQEQRFDDAQQCLESSLKVAPTAAAWRNLGTIHRVKKDLQKALSCHQEALKIDPNDPASLSQLAETFFAGGDTLQAAAYYAFAILANPKELKYKERFIGMGSNVNFVKYADVIENAIVECLKTPEVDFSPAQALWYNVFALNPAFTPLYKINPGGKVKLLQRADGLDTFNKETFDKAGDYTALSRPFFLLGLKGVIVSHPAFEEFLTHIRAQVLSGKLKLPLEVIAALSHYCFNTEYIFDLTPEEQQAADALRKKIEAGGASPEEIAIYACYAPLSSLANAASLSPAGLADVIALQVRENLSLQETRKTIEAITPIDDAISQKVRAQYEESPYPRWRTCPKFIFAEKPGLSLKNPGAKILIAGCGTGSDAVQFATVFPEAEVLAVDLSLTSLSYAINKAREHKIPNLTFRQADILKLGSIGKTFDGIISGGVLHHMEDPVKGWRVLTGLLKPGGVMKIALYSKIARRHLLACHDIVKTGNYGTDIPAMRAFRRNSAKILGNDLLKIVARFDDYYTMSMYRDMMFHVQEHDLDLTQIATMLKQLGLTFRQFSLPPAVTAQYLAAYPADPEAANLGNWHKFEQRNPDTFSAMYQFWCEKG
ncbi:MAG: methyltransferase domain-containing protein [Alphaproteobacteria bacterium]|nr:MAG: methyltransferase domain-containing protein [Alphaproteobacteria bacterium]